jgi:VIT1/CCC1 family predicted Fe2+/Mn2+ transporter
MTQSNLIVIGGILTIAIADSFSDALGIHFAQESEDHLTHSDIWKSTIFTFISKFIFSSIFIIPVLIFELRFAIILSVIIGLYLIFFTSLLMARRRNDNPLIVCGEHLIIAISVIIITHYAGILISNIFGI